MTYVRAELAIPFFNFRATVASSLGTGSNSPPPNFTPRPPESINSDGEIGHGVKNVM